MPTFMVSVVWSMSARVEIEAESEDKAREIVVGSSFPLPMNGRYLEDSFEVDSVEELIYCDYCKGNYQRSEGHSCMEGRSR